MTRWRTPAEISEALGVNASKVSSWIRSGELEAIDVSLRRGAKPRWRISPASLESFLLRRSAAKPVPRVSRSRKPKATNEIEFF